jgi:ribosomal protein S6
VKIQNSFYHLLNLKAAPEEVKELRRLIKSSNESLGPYLFGKFEFWNF